MHKEKETAEESVENASPVSSGFSEVSAHNSEPVQCRFEGGNSTSSTKTAAPSQLPENNTGMPSALKNGLESLSGFDLSSVRVHYNSPKPHQLGAFAYAQGNNIHLGRGQEKHLPHEAWHVVQQKQGRVKATYQLKDKFNINDDSSLEREADIMGEKALSIGRSSAPGEIKNGLTTSNNTGQNVAQCARGDYRRLWEKDPQLAKLSISQTTGFADFQRDALQFEQALGAGLFSHRLAHEGANALLNAIIHLLTRRGALAAFGAEVDAENAGSVPADTIEDVLREGNIREKMYMVYTAIRSGEIAKKIGTNKGDALPRTRGGDIDTWETTNRYLPRRYSTSTQDRIFNDRNATQQDRMTARELRGKNASLSARERRLARGRDPLFVPGEFWYSIEPDRELRDTSLPRNRNRKTYQQYQLERLVPLVSGLSGSADWYFNVANQLGLGTDDKKKLRLAALGQMLVNRDHSFHEVMHEARTQGKLGDYPDELPIGYTTLSPLDEGSILTAANNAREFPGDAEAALFNRQDRQGQRPRHLARDFGLPTSTGLRHLAGAPTKRWKIFGGAEKGRRYLAVLSALDEYSRTNSRRTKRRCLQTVSSRCDAWLRGHQDPRAGSKYARRATVLKWLKEKADAMLQGESGPELQPWITADYFDDAASAKAAILHDAQQEALGGITEADQKRIFRKALKRVNRLMAQQDLPELLSLQQSLSRELSRTTNVMDADFVSSSDDLALDMDINIATEDLPTDDALMRRDWLEVLKSNVIANVKIIREARSRMIGPQDNSDIDRAPPAPPDPRLAILPARMHAGIIAQAQQEVSDEVDTTYSTEIRDFQNNINTTMLAHVEEGTPMDNFLRRLNGQPLPKELAAISAYAEDGFYQNMNYVLNNWDDPRVLRAVPVELLKLCKLAASGLRKMKPYTGGTVYRAIPGYHVDDMKEMLKDSRPERERTWQRDFSGNWTSNQFISTSKRWASSYAVKNHKFIAVEIRQPKTGVDISAISNTLYEREVLFPPGAPLRSRRVTDKFVTLDERGRVRPGSEGDRMNIPYENRNDLGRVHVVLEEQ